MKLPSPRSVGLWLLIVLAVAILNLVVGRLCLLLAVGPSYATAVFAPAGIALAVMLIFGTRVWPGIFLGAWALSPALGDSALTSTTISFSIAAGSTLQAVVGAWLIRRAVGFPTPLDDERSIAKFFILGGPVACTISATWGMATVKTAGIEIDNLLYDWTTWWVGDSIGVMIFAPLLLICAGQPREVWRPRWLTVGVPLAIAFGVVVSLYYYARENAESDTRLEFNHLADTIHGALASKTNSYRESLNSIVGLYQSSVRVDRSEFRLFVERTFARQPGITAIGWVPRIPSEAWRQHEQETRQEALQDSDEAVSRALEQYRVKQWQANDTWTPYEKMTANEFYPVHFIEPHRNNEAALGIDLGSNPARLAALQRARDTGQPIATAPIQLAQEVEGRLSLLLIVPIQVKGLPQETVQNRRDNLSGFVSGVVRLHEVVESAVDPFDLALVQISLLDNSPDQSQPRLLYGQSPEEVDKAATPEQIRLRSVSEFDVGGRSWQLQATPSTLFMKTAHNRELWGELAIGFLFTVSVVISTLLVTGRKRQVELLVAERTNELRVVRFAMDHMADSIFWINDQGRFFDVSRSACEKLGYSREELLSMYVWDIDPDYPRARWGANRGQLREHGRMLFESRHEKKDGQIFPVEVSTGYMAFLGEDYLCAIARDITDRKNSENRLKSDEEFLRSLLDLQERERRTVALEIHDGFVQYAVGAQMQAEALRPDDDGAAPTPLKMVISLLKKAINEGRGMISDLRPMVIDESGIVSAIEHLLADERKRGLDVDFAHQVLFERLDPMLESAIFRIVQEALNNVRHHSRTSQAIVRMTQEGDQLSITIQDDGVGFDPEQISHDRFGLRGIRERAHLFGGAADIESRPDGGTVVRVDLPISQLDTEQKP